MADDITIHFVGPHPKSGERVLLYEARMVAVPRVGDRVTFPAGGRYEVVSVSWAIGESGDHGARIEVTPALEQERL